MEVARRCGAKEVTKTTVVVTMKTVAEDDEEDATIEDEAAEDGIGSRDRSASSDTKLMWNKCGEAGSSLGGRRRLPGRR